MEDAKWGDSKGKYYTGDYLLQNLRIETGFIYDNDHQRTPDNISGTATELVSLYIKDGQIAQILKAEDVLPAVLKIECVDAKGQLLLPPFRDMHTHLDKTLYGLPWQAVAANRKTVYDMIAYEQQIIPTLLESSIERSTQLIERMQRYGTSFARSHFNIDPSSGMRSLAHLLRTLDGVKECFDAELVAFPQHGVFYTKSADLLKEAASHPAVGYVGGVDPYGVDGHIEKVLDYTVGLAIDYDKGIDLHLHDGGSKGVETLQYLIKLVEQNPLLKSKTYVSHAYVLSSLEEPALEEIAQALAAARIGVVSAIPFGHGSELPVNALRACGVDLLVGTDNIQDHWSTFGSGSMLEQVYFMARLYGWHTEFGLSRALGYATGGLLPLSSDGARQWPMVGDKADFILVKASVSAEAVARRAQVGALAKKGRLRMFDND